MQYRVILPGILQKFKLQEVCALEYSMLQHRPSVIAAAAIFTVQV